MISFDLGLLLASIGLAFAAIMSVPSAAVVICSAVAFHVQRRKCINAGNVNVELGAEADSQRNEKKKPSW